MKSVRAGIQRITQRIGERSKSLRRQYEEKIRKSIDEGVHRRTFNCSNMAHACAAASLKEKQIFIKPSSLNIAIISAYNDMLSAHQPFKDFPDRIKKTSMQYGATAQVASGVPAMCDGITQSEKGMELSLFSRDVIALSATIGLSHQCFDAVIFLGTCDKIIPGLTMAAGTFGHLPTIMLPAGPMPSGMANEEKSRLRQQFARGEIDRETLLHAEMQSYHSPGTCTFYGTANTNQLLMEVMGLHLPGSTFVSPSCDLRHRLTEFGVKRVLSMCKKGESFLPVYRILTVKTWVNAMVALLASGGSTNLVIHLIAMARTSGVIIDIQDFADLSKIVPLINRVYPNGYADINAFHDVGGTSVFIDELLSNGLLHQDVKTVFGGDLSDYTNVPLLDDAQTLQWKNGHKKNHHPPVMASVEHPFSKTGGLEVLRGNLGRSVIKVSAMKKEHYHIKAKAKVFYRQEQIQKAFEKGDLNQDVVCVLLFQGVKANGMPELHGITPVFNVLQSQGYRIALVTDGRMSGASGSIPAAIHCTPEAYEGGNIAKIRDGDLIELNVNEGTLNVLEVNFAQRECMTRDLSENEIGCGRELFGVFRRHASSVDNGASIF